MSTTISGEEHIGALVNNPTGNDQKLSEAVKDFQLTPIVEEESYTAQEAVGKKVFVDRDDKLVDSKGSQQKLISLAEDDDSAHVSKNDRDNYADKKDTDGNIIYTEDNKPDSDDVGLGNVINPIYQKHSVSIDEENWYRIATALSSSKGASGRFIVAIENVEDPEKCIIEFEAWYNTSFDKGIRILRIEGEVLKIDQVRFVSNVDGNHLDVHLDNLGGSLHDCYFYLYQITDVYSGFAGIDWTDLANISAGTTFDVDNGNTVSTNDEVDSKVSTHNGISEPHASATKIGGRAIPNSNLVGLSSSQTLTNKAIDAESNTLTNIQQIKSQSVIYGNTSPVEVMGIPAGAVITSVFVRVTKVFDGSPSNFVVGDTATSNGFLTDISSNLGVAGFYGMEFDLRGGTYIWNGTSPVKKGYTASDKIYATFNFGGATEGELVVYVEYYVL
jgi:hypothetical protein